MTDKLSRLTFTIIIAIFGVSFILSYVALQDVAARYGAAGWWSFGWPLLIDLPLVAFSLSAIRSALSGLSTNRQWSMVGLYTLATIGFNLAHAQSSWLGWAVAIVPPVTLFLSFETAMQMVRQDIERQDRQPMHKMMDKARHSETTLPVNDNGLTATLQNPDNGLTESDKKVTKGDIDLTSLTGPDDRAPYVVKFVRQGMTDEEIADKLGVSARTVKRDKGRLNGHG